MYVTERSVRVTNDRSLIPDTIGLADHSFGRNNLFQGGDHQRPYWQDGFRALRECSPSPEDSHYIPHWLIVIRSGW